MNKEKTEKKTAVGCLLMVALFFFVLAVYQCNDERQERRARQELKQSHTESFIADTTAHTKRTASGSFASTDDEETDGDPYDNPDFDDLFPGEEYDEEFVDRSEGDRELYDEPE